MEENHTLSDKVKMNVVEIEQNIKDIGLVLLESILGKKNQNLRDPVLCF